MANSASDGWNEGKPKNSDNVGSLCGYKDINEFSQVTTCAFI